MAFLFGGRGRQRSPAEIARSLKDVLLKLEENPKVCLPRQYYVVSLNAERLPLQVEDEVAKYMSQMKLIVQGTPGESVCASVFLANH